MNKKKEFFIINYKKEKINIVWDEYFVNGSDISILQYIENNSTILKDKYVTLVEKIGFMKLKKKNLINIFSIKKNFSYWWITDIYEKSFYKHPAINEVIKLLAFECIVKKKLPKAAYKIIFPFSMAGRVGLQSLVLDIV